MWISLVSLSNNDKFQECVDCVLCTQECCDCCIVHPSVSCSNTDCVFTVNTVSSVFPCELVTSSFLHNDSLVIQSIISQIISMQRTLATKFFFLLLVIKV